jgi:hypothetical protein
MLLVVLVWAPSVRAEFHLSDQDRVAFFGTRVLVMPDIPTAVEAFIRIRYPELKARFRTFGQQTPGIFAGALERFEKEVKPFEPTVLVLCFGTVDIPQRSLDEGHLQRAKKQFAELLGRVKESGARIYVLTPLCPEPGKAERLKKAEYEKSVARYAEMMRALAQENGCAVIDWYAQSKVYRDEHRGNKRLSITVDGVRPSVLGSNIGTVAILSAWETGPCQIKVTADWKGETAAASMGMARLTRIDQEKAELKLSGMPIPWVVPNRGAILEGDWPGTRYYSFILKIQNVPDGGIMISEKGGKNALPYLSEQLRQGTDMGFVGPLTKLDSVMQLNKWIRAKQDAVTRWQEFMRRPIPEPEYRQAYETYYVGMEQYADATGSIVMRQPRTIDVTLDVYKAPLPPGTGAQRGIQRGGGVEAGSAPMERRVEKQPQRVRRGHSAKERPDGTSTSNKKGGGG